MNGDYCSCGERKKNSNKRLIDADELLDRVRGNYFYFDISGIIDEMLSDKDDEAQTPHYRDPHFATQGGLAMTNDEIVRALRCYASDCNNDDACKQCTFAWMCDECDGNAPEIIAARIDSLTSQFADSQRREQAAVEDWKTYEESGQCDVCKYGKDGDCTYPEGGRCKFEWRGPQEAGNGETE